METHLCNYDITEMPKQKEQTRDKREKLHEQVFSEERSAQVKELEQKAEAIKNTAAQHFRQKLKRKREQRLADQEKKNKNKKDKRFSKDKIWRN